MRRFRFRFSGMIAALALALLCAPAAAAELSQGEKDTIFIGKLLVQPSVMNKASMDGKIADLQRAYDSLDSQFTTALNATRVFQLVERKRKGDIELEQSFAAVAVDPDDKKGAQAGKMAGAKFAFLPQIDGFEERSETNEYQAIGRSDVTRKIFLSAVVQIVDTTTGKLLPDSPSVQLTKEEVLENVRFGQGGGGDQLLVALAKEMAQRLSQEVVSLLRPAKVLSVTGRQIMINRGSEAGFNKGDTVEIYATEEVRDEDTGEMFRNEVPVGKGTVGRLDKKQSFAAVFEDFGVARGCVVRVIEAAGPSAAQESAELSPASGNKPLKW